MGVRKELKELKKWLGWSHDNYGHAWKSVLKKPCVDPVKLVEEFKKLRDQHCGEHRVDSWEIKTLLDKIGYLESRVTRLDSTEQSGNTTIYPVRELIRALYNHLGLVAEEVPSTTAFLRAVPKIKPKFADNKEK